MALRFSKLHGAGNDYLFVAAQGDERDWPRLAREMSHRHFGVGADGLILALPAEKAHLRMRMFNADGSEGEMCGNGIRCLVRFAFDQGLIPPDTSPVLVETAAGLKSVTPLWEDGVMVAARVGMGPPALRPSQVPMRVEGQGPVKDHPLEVEGRRFLLTGVSMGNPHAVAFLQEPVDEVPLERLGPLVERHPLFPRRTNFEIVNVLGPDHLRVRVWERGSGITMACGTGACAVVVAARLHGMVDDEVTVSLPGGDLTVRWTGSGEVVLQGPVAHVFDGRWPEG